MIKVCIGFLFLMLLLCISYWVFVGGLRCLDYVLVYGVVPSGCVCCFEVWYAGLVLWVVFGLACLFALVCSLYIGLVVAF